MRAEAAAGTLGFAPPWDLPVGVRAWITTRSGGVSAPPFDSLNLATHVGDAAAAVQANRARLRALLPAEPRWLEQVHGTRVLDADDAAASSAVDAVVADAVVTSEQGVVCAIQTADCLPVLLVVDDGRAIGAAHAGWRGLAAGVIAAAVRTLCAKAAVEPLRLTAYLGPAISGAAYEVGQDVFDAMTRDSARAARAFTPKAGGKYQLDLFAIARDQLATLGIERVAGGLDCTARDADRFFSYRRDGRTGRFASLIWRE